MSNQVVNKTTLSTFSKEQIAKAIDHTLLKADASHKEIEKLCEEAITHGFFSVCVNSSRVKIASELVKNSNVLVCAVVGFPLGAMDTDAKAYETKKCIENGAREVDMVINLGLLRDKNENLFLKDIEAVVKAASPYTVKVILETCLLTDDEISWASALSVKAGAHFVKTSTGFSTGGATMHAVEIMKKAVGANAQIKASGGIRDIEAANSYLSLGVTRLGTSSGIKILEGQKVESGY